jgi:hypothetical protein
VVIRGTAAAVALVAAALVGCSAEADPTPLPPAPLLSPTPQALPVPSEALATTPEAASVFARYYLDLVNQAFEIGDATAVRAVSHSECDACNNLIAAIERPDSPGQTSEGGDYEVLFAATPGGQGEDVIVDVRYALAEGIVRDGSGAVIKRVPANPGVDAQMRLVRGETGWMVRGFRNVG